MENKPGGQRQSVSRDPSQNRRLYCDLNNSNMDRQTELATQAGI